MTQNVRRGAVQVPLCWGLQWPQWSHQSDGGQHVPSAPAVPKAHRLVAGFPGYATADLWCSGTFCFPSLELRTTMQFSCCTCVCAWNDEKTQIYFTQPCLTMSCAVLGIGHHYFGSWLAAYSASSQWWREGVLVSTETSKDAFQWSFNKQMKNLHCNMELTHLLLKWQTFYLSFQKLKVHSLVILKHKRVTNIKSSFFKRWRTYMTVPSALVFSARSACIWKSSAARRFLARYTGGLQ